MRELIKKFFVYNSRCPTNHSFFVLFTYYSPFFKKRAQKTGTDSAVSFKITFAGVFVVRVAH